MDLPPLPPGNRERLLENFVNVTHTLLGLRLQPFCILHLLWLQHISSPFVDTSKPVTLADIELAALVCSSRSSEEILSKLSAKNGGRWKRTWANLWHWRNTKTDLQAASRALLVYQDDYCSLPEFADSKGDDNEKIPYLLLQVAALAKETGWPEETILTLPLGKVVWYNAAFAYLRTGETGVISDKEQQAMAALRQLTGGV